MSPMDADQGKNQEPEDSTARIVENHYRGLKVIVTGGLGFIGSNVAKRLVLLGAKVIVMDCLRLNSGGNAANLKGYEDKLAIELIDLRDCNKRLDLFEGVSAVFNLAGTVSHLDSMNDPIADMEANVHAQIALLECCRRYVPQAQVVFASTRQIYGRPVKFPVDETHPLNPIDVNGINKMAAEAYHLLYHRVYDLRTVSLRLTNTYGPGMRIMDARQTFLGIWLRRVVENSVFEVWGGRQLRDFAYIEDVVDAFLVAGWSGSVTGRAFNIGGGPAISLHQLADLVVQIGESGRYEIREFPAERLRIDIGDYFADDRAFRDLTGWAPRTPLEDGLMRTLAYYRSCLEAYV
ncbi:MAG: NAD-dependent epimerase/dehydratase family protein [Terracidiphilus sp.]